KALQFLADADTGLDWPRVIATLSGNRIVPIGNQGGPAFFVRLLTWVEGDVFAQVRPQTPELRASLGRALASIDLAFARFSHPAAARVLHWDLRQARLARPYLALLPEAGRALVEP